MLAMSSDNALLFLSPDVGPVLVAGRPSLSAVSLNTKNGLQAEALRIKHFQSRKWAASKKGAARSQLYPLGYCMQYASTHMLVAVATL
jgi:hypothetical protein